MTIIRISVPDQMAAVARADYLHLVAEQIENGCAEGHVDAQRHWTATEFTLDRCNYCGRESHNCSTDPCAGVREDRGEVGQWREEEPQDAGPEFPPTHA